jgi:hypothetical protein
MVRPRQPRAALSSTALIAPQGLQHHAVGVEVPKGVAQRHHMQSRLIAPARWTYMLRCRAVPGDTDLPVTDGLGRDSLRDFCQARD